VAEVGVAEQRVVGVDERLVAAPVDVERAGRGRDPRRLEVGVDVRAAEGVDGLLGVADEHERRLAVAECAAHDPPLDRVGVLELVDEHDAVAAAQAGGDLLAARPVQRAVQPREQVVVVHDPEPVLADLDLRAHARGEPVARVGLRARRAVRGLERRARVAIGGERDGQRLAAVEQHVLARVEGADVEVIDDLLDQLAQILDERDPGLQVARDAEAAEDLLAEAVRGHDRGRVEVRDRRGQAAPPVLDLGGRRVGEQREHAVAAVGRRAGQRKVEALLGGDEALADAVAQLGGGHAREGHDQHLVERDARRDVARGQAGDRERLAGAGARLEHGDALGQWPADVERRRLDRRAHRSSISSTSSRSVHSRAA
jgi:hypothetical protein